jgi:hypothetical protein
MTAPTLIGNAVYALLQTVPEAGAAYPLMAPQTALLPYVIYQRIDGERFGSLTGPSGLAQTRIQVDCYATSYEAAQLAAETIRRKLDGYSGTIGGVRIGGVSKATDLPDQIDLEAETTTGQKAFRASKDYLFTHEEH